MTAGTSGVSIVCVYNNPSVRTECLDESIIAYDGDIDVDYIRVDNTDHTFASAGAALNHGARQARHELVVFVHQDVYLHSIERLVSAGRAFQESSWGLLGANGVTSAGESVGRMRDRTQLIGRHTLVPLDVDSVDEVLFMVPRKIVREHPLTEDKDLAWHAYAVEYGVRMRMLGRRVGAVDLAVTHNSLTINLDRLDVAHRRVAALYSHLTPIRTTCGTVGGRSSGWREAPVIRTHRWRARWLKGSLLAFQVRRRMAGPVVLSDIRHEVDLLRSANDSPLYLVNLDRLGGFAEYACRPLRLTRYDRTVIMQCAPSREDLLKLLSQLPSDARILVEGIVLDDLHTIRERTGGDRRWLVGIQAGELWLLSGTSSAEHPEEWSRPQAVPLGDRAPRG